MINLLEESVRAVAKETISAQLRMDWTDSVFREHPKYYGDVEFKCDDKNIIGDSGIASCKKFLAFRHSNKIGILSTDFDTNIEEKLASGRKAEYGSKLYTTRNIDTIETGENNINVLQFSGYNDAHLFCGDSIGALSIFNIASVAQHSTLLSTKLASSVNCIAQHPSSSDVLAIGGFGNISVIDLVKGGESLVSTKIMDGSDDIVAMTYALDANCVRGVTRDKKWLFTYDPRCDTEITNAIALRYTPNGIVNLYGTDEIAVCGLTSYLEPTVNAYNITGGLREDNIYDKYVFSENWKHKHCAPMMRYDRFTQLLYLTFRGCADLLTLNTSTQFTKEAVYHAADDTFMAFDMLPKHAVKKREMNRIIKFSNTNRIQQIVHSRGGKLIYETIASKPKASMVSVDDYFTQNVNTSYPDDDIARCISQEYHEEKKRSVSLYTHVTGKEPQNTKDKYFDLKLSQTVNCNLGQNIKCNSKYALFPCPTYGGGALGVIELKTTGRKKQTQLSGHSEKISTFDVCRIAGNEDLVITGSPDCKAMIWRIEESGINKLYTVQCVGKVTFVAFHPRINGLCVVAANSNDNAKSMIYLYDYGEGRLIADDGPYIVVENAKNIMDIQFEGVRGLIAAVSCSGGEIKLFDIRNSSSQVLLQFKCSETGMRDTKLFWACSNGGERPSYMNRLICLGFAKGSVRKFSLYDVEDAVANAYDNNQSKTEEEKEAKEEEAVMKCVASVSFGVSNAIPIGYYDCNDNLFYVTSIGDRKIRSYEFNTKGEIHEMNAAYPSEQDIQGIAFMSKQSVNVSKVEIARCLKLTKDGVIAPVSFYIPRKRMEYFQDDIYSDVLDVDNAPAIDIKRVFNADADANANDEFNICYVSLKPNEMQLLSEAPEEELTQRQKRRKSQVEAMEANKLKQQPQSTAQAFDQFSRMVADAPTANRWDAQNIGTEVADDEWDD